MGCMLNSRNEDFRERVSYEKMKYPVDPTVDEDPAHGVGVEVAPRLVLLAHGGDDLVVERLPRGRLLVHLVPVGKVGLADFYAWVCFPYYSIPRFPTMLPIIPA